MDSRFEDEPLLSSAPDGLNPIVAGETYRRSSADSLAQQIESIMRDQSLLGKAKKATELIERLDAAVETASGIRRKAMRVLVDGGMDMQELGDRIGLSKSRVSQILSKPDAAVPDDQ